MVGRERLCLGGGDLERHLTGEDAADLLAGHVADLVRGPGFDREAVEDVVVLVSCYLRDRTDHRSVGGGDIPALFDL